MRFAVQPAAMNGPEAVQYALDAILFRVEDEVHEMDIPQADQLEESLWYRSSRPVRQKLLEKIAEASLYRGLPSEGPHLRQAEVTDAASATQARSLAYSPLLVLLENDVSDAALVEAALKKFAKPATVELCFGAPSRLAPPSFEMESRGGFGELEKLISKRRDEAASQGRMPRLVVVTDSDGEWVGDVKKHAQDIRKDCKQATIPCPPLNKRKAENYIPDAVWRAWSDEPKHTSSRPAVAALLRLSPEQRDHVQLDDTNKPPWNEAEPAAVLLFQTPKVSAADRDVLTKASLKGSGSNMKILALRVYAGKFTPDDLRARDHQGDLQRLVRHIEDEL